MKGCIAFAEAEICRTHQQFPADELRDLLKRDAGLIGQLKPIAVGIEYERSDGSQYGIDHDGNYYDIE